MIKVRTAVWASLVMLTACGAAGAGQDAGEDSGVDAAASCDPGDASYAPTLAVRLLDGGAPGSPVAWSEPLDVVVSGTPPCAMVSFDYALESRATSHAVFQASTGGRVSSALDAPLMGTWSGADPDGPLWSMTGSPQGSVNLLISATWSGGTLKFTQPRVVAPADEVIVSIRAQGVTGEFFRHTAGTQRPTLIVLGGSEGGLTGSHYVAQGLVGQGYNVLALGYFGVGATPPSLVEIPVETVGRALTLIKGFADVDPNRLGLIGVSRGSELALLAATKWPDFKAVVGLVPSGVLWPAWQDWTHASWTFAGTPLPFVPWANAPAGSVPALDGGVAESSTPQFAASLDSATGEQLTLATIPVEATSASVLLLAAEDDQIWPSCRLGQVAMTRLQSKGHTSSHPLDGFECYPAAGHAMNPVSVGLPTTGMHDNGGVAYGGTPVGNAHAIRQAWNRVTAFLRATL